MEYRKSLFGITLIKSKLPYRIGSLYIPENKYRDLIQYELNFFKRFARVSFNGIHCSNTGVHFKRYKRHCWHLSFDYKAVRGITLSYGNKY